MAFLRKVNAGTQNGRDVELVYLDETRQKRRCYFECKFIHSKKLKEENILAKILQVQREAKEEIEHWILVAPNARLDNYSVALFEDAERNPGKYYPIKNIQVWNEANQIQDLFGIEPEMYNIFFENQVQAESSPEEWGEVKKQQIIQAWKQKLAPVILLPEGLRFYPSQPQNLIFDLQNNLQERKKYEDLYHDYARLYYYDENGVLSQECLEDDMINWLYSSTGDIKVITGEYGDGKTFFLYCLCRKLLKEFTKNPQKNYLPIIISLKSLKIDKSPEKLIERRMRELGCNYSDFQSLKENFHILFCLDGFDEISSTIDYNTIQQNARLLAECCDYFCGAKIIITSRKQCFYENKVNEWLCKRLGGFEVLSIAPVKLMDRESFILSKVEENDRLAKWEQLNTTGKIQALMAKPFFLDMTRQLLESGEKLGEDSIVSIYEHYIRSCLARKFYMNFERENTELLDEAQIVDRIYNALQSLAYILQSQGKEDLPKCEIEKYLGKPLTEVLWLENEADDIAKEDADNRFSMRTLLKYGENGKVTFSHRSFREYFVAVHLMATMDEHLDELRLVLTNSYYNYEILSFFAEQIKSEPEKVDDRVESLIALVNLSGSEGDDCDMSLAAKVMQILYYINKTIPKAEWSGKNLSGIDISGANFSKQNFSGTKFLKANLNNVILDGCDCSYCDMRGARLGETNKILALKFDGEKLLSLYKDGSIRKWDMNRLEEISCIVGCASANDAFFGNGADLFVQDNSVIELLGKQKNKMITHIRYIKNQDFTLLSVYEGRILIKESRIAKDCISLINTNDFKTEHNWYVGQNSKGIIVNNQLAIIYDGDVSIELYSIIQQQYKGNIDISMYGEISSLAAHESNGNTFVALSYGCGEIHVYQCSIHKSKLIAKGRGFDYGLSHLVFCGASTLAAANSYGEICLLH
ncbi:MAG: pentapeptide repeat-containing protein, partial [Blautia marasmi]